jgi:hypothetical protein
MVLVRARGQQDRPWELESREGHLKQPEGGPIDPDSALTGIAYCAVRDSPIRLSPDSHRVARHEHVRVQD